MSSTLKVLVLGDAASGKSSLIKRYVHDFFTDRHKTTIGVDFSVKIVSAHEDHEEVKVQLWDIAGQDRVGSIARVYFKDSVGAIIVVDLSKSSGLNNLTKWREEILSKVNVPIFVVAAKSDLVEPSETVKSQLDEFCKEPGMVGWLAVSSKLKTNVTEAITLLVRHIVVTTQVSLKVLWRFAKDGDVSKLKELIAKEFPIDEPDKDGKTPLMWAAKEGHTECLIEIIAHNAQLEARDKEGLTALIMAVNAGKAESVKLLLSNGAQVDAVDTTGRSALILAAKEAQLDVVNILLANGAQVELQDKNGQSACSHASSLEVREILTRHRFPALFSIPVVNENMAALRSHIFRNTTEFPDDKTLRLHIFRQAMRNSVLPVVTELFKLPMTVDDFFGDGNNSLWNEFFEMIIRGNSTLNPQNFSSDMKKFISEEQTKVLFLWTQAAMQKYSFVLTDFKSESLALQFMGLFAYFYAGWKLELSDEKLKAMIVARALEKNVPDLVNRYLPDLALEDLCDESACIWTDLVFMDRNNVYDEQIFALLNKYDNNLQMLTAVKDRGGRRAIDIARVSVRNEIHERSRFLRQYEFRPGPPEHQSATCIVKLATDAKATNASTVAMKFMMNEDQFEREVQVRSSGQFNPKYVIGITHVHTGEEFKMAAEKAGLYPHCIIMEAANRSLKAIIDHEHIAGREWEIIRTYSKQLVQGLAHIHGQGYIHGDVKPLNIMRVGDQLTYIDLDASVSFVNNGYAGAKYSSAYIPPELLAVKGKDIVIRSSAVAAEDRSYELLAAHPSFDMWSLGVTLFQLFTDKTLFHADGEGNLSTAELSNLANWTDAHKKSRLIGVRNIAARYLLWKLLSKDASRRPTAQDLLEHPFFSDDALVTDDFILKSIEDDPDFSGGYIDGRYGINLVNVRVLIEALADYDGNSKDILKAHWEGPPGDIFTLLPVDAFKPVLWSQLPNIKYAAMSYEWSGIWQLIVKYMAHATEGMQCEWVWTDVFCLDQNDHLWKMKTIEKSWMIYYYSCEYHIMNLSALKRGWVLFEVASVNYDKCICFRVHDVLLTTDPKAAADVREYLGQHGFGGSAFWRESDRTLVKALIEFKFGGITNFDRHINKIVSDMFGQLEKRQTAELRSDSDLMKGTREALPEVPADKSSRDLAEEVEALRVELRATKAEAAAMLTRVEAARADAEAARRDVDDAREREAAAIAQASASLEKIQSIMLDVEANAILRQPVSSSTDPNGPETLRANSFVVRMRSAIQDRTEELRKFH